MKIAKILYLPITVVASCLLGLNNSVVNTNNINDEAVEVSADTVVEYDYIAFNEANFSKVSGEDDFVVFKKSETFWDRYLPYGAIDDFRGWDNESKLSVYKSVSWTQKADKPYITFTLGGNTSNYVNVVYKSGDVTETVTVHPHSGNWIMIPRMVKTPTSITGDATVYVELHDVTIQDYGEIIFGGLQANQTAEDAKQTIELWKKGMKKPHYDNQLTDFYNINLNYLSSQDEFTDARNATITKNTFYEDFEESDWLLDWTLDYSYNNLVNPTKIDFPCRDYYWSNARSNAANHAQDNMPYNQSGNLYFHGFYEANNEGINQGFIANNSDKYRIVSKAFVLNSDLISVKLSGNGAQLQLLEDHDLENDESTGLTVLGTIQGEFVSGGDTTNIASSGAFKNTMTRYVADVSSFKGKTVRIGMVDSSDSKDWGAINVDEIKTIDNLDGFSFKVDTFTQSNSTGTFYGQITDKFVNLNGETASSVSYVQEAYNFLQTYYSTLRSKDNGINFCGDTAISDAVKTLLTYFNNLSDDAANIVNRSMDYNHGASATADNWYNTQTETFEVWRTIDYLMKLNNISNSHSYNPYNNVLLNNSNNNTIIITSVIVIAMTALSIGGFILLKKKRMKKQ